jgi:restriction endonuclease S subunit
MGTGQPNVNATALKSLLFPIPPLAEQQRIVAKIDHLMLLCDQLELQRNERKQTIIKVHTTAIDRLLVFGK